MTVPTPVPSIASPRTARRHTAWVRGVTAVAACSALVAALVAGPTALGQSPATPKPATRPSTRPSPFGNRMVRMSDFGLAAPEWPQPLGDRSVTEDEWQEIVSFAKENFPNRWKAFEQLQARRGENSNVIRQLRDRFVGRYRLLMRVQRAMPELFDSALKQGQLEDDAWGAVVDSARKPNDKVLADAKRQKVEALLKNLLQERETRLDTLRKTLVEEQKQLDADRDNLDELIDRQIARLSGTGPGGPWGGGWGGRGFGGPWGGRGWDRPEPQEYHYDRDQPTTQPDQ